MGDRPPAKTSSSDMPLEFFKVYLPSFSSHQLLIPPDFVKHLKGVVPEKAFLKDTTGRSWPIGIAEVGNKLFIKSGWRDFVIGHSLDFADFLIFRYNGDSVFLVKVFSKNGCRKQATLGVNRQSTVVKTEELAEEANEAEQKQGRPSRACKRKFIGENQTGTRFIGENVSKSGLETYIMMKNLHFVSCISKCSLNVVLIPGSILRTNRIANEMTVRDQNGKTWSMHIKVRKDGRDLTFGWTAFREKNNLRGSRCSKTNVGVLPLGLKIQKNHKYFVMKASFV
ncbi:hypothetical protein ACJRO7_030879 [Eucalyptus globulus]|uniref:TF-B3 domain-containing protein n=1 Tax=Eucalyptus globulus TaxID=34317 RepID=A0ABD3JD06_EUCGL